MQPGILQIILLGLIQGAAEMLPVSSSAHVIVAEKLMRLDPSRPELTFLLVMLHTGTMAAAIAYFWRAWRLRFFANAAQSRESVRLAVVATAWTGAVGYGLKIVIEKVFLGGGDKAEIEQLFSSLPLIAAALFVAGVVIIWSAAASRKRAPARALNARTVSLIGVVQGLVIPFRGLSRSGCTISAGMLAGVPRQRAEEFSFGLGVAITPVFIAWEAARLLKANAAAAVPVHLVSLLLPGMVGMAASFLAALVGLRWLSRWLENGKWHHFGSYCLVAAAVIFTLALGGF